jgi:DNA repair photolyase
MKEFKSFYKEVKNRKFNTWCKYTTRLDTYGCGCQHDCGYCYAKSLLSFRGLWDAKNPSITNIANIYNTIDLSMLGRVLRMGGMTDCFQPLEIKNRVTYKTLRFLNMFKIHYLIVTKSDLVADDKYIDIYDKKLAHFQITITTTDDKKSLEYEKASSPSKRIKAVEKLYKLGFDVSVRLSPFIENNINLSIINNINCDKILIEFLKVNHWIKKWFNINYEQYSVKYGGYSHLTLDKKIDLVNKINMFNQKSVGEYVDTHYKYFKKNVNYNEHDCCNLRFN